MLWKSVKNNINYNIKQKMNIIFIIVKYKALISLLI